ncbi:methyl-accepting chemotaxis protein [Bisbaumannia pacifica]|uniref:Methyl-accepting chemotaxis protein n=1 Tax=Bisbaumannia pacifica TaxID=77098 RepID=A0A510X5V4_9GAMM|nr:methyl-accepting chemotaxis protein [Halomonas pacifica]MBH8579310.1 Tar ligand binding domain-containing protein [Halomonas pacifica]GEK45815.1 methyl-accepting chemotaxis protein [Halomonas pacifica]
MNLTIKARLTLLIGLLIASIAIVGGLGIRGMTAMDRATKTIYEDRMIPVQQLARIDELMRDAIIELNQVSLTHEGSADPATARANRRPYLEGVQDNLDTMERVWESYMASYLTPREATLAQRYADQRGAFVREGVEPTIAMMEAGEIERATAHMIEAVRPAFMAANRTLQELIALQGEVAQQEHAAAQSTSDMMRYLTAALLALALVIASLGGWLLIRAIARPLARMTDYFHAIAAGNLNNAIEIGRQDELGLALKALDDTQAQQRALVARIQSSARAIHAAAGEVASGNHDLSQRTEEQAASLQETAASMEQVASTVKQNADTTRQANELARHARELADNGGALTQGATGKMQELEASADKIGSIISVIDGIAFQTNILALNASVEAARAGEQGRGFAVVAGEVRNLAQRCAAAAKEIQSLVTLDGDLVKEGSTLVKQAGEAMEQVVTSVRRVSELMTDINAASEEQAQAVEQVSVAVNQMDRVTQQNAALVEQSAAAASSLGAEAELLTAAVSGFRMGDGDLDGAVAPEARLAAAAPRAASASLPRVASSAATREPEWEAF